MTLYCCAILLSACSHTSTTPKSYQNWLLSQDWFKMPKKEIPLHRQSLNGWDGYSKWGEAIEDTIFANDCLAPVETIICSGE